MTCLQKPSINTNNNEILTHYNMKKNIHSFVFSHQFSLQCVDLLHDARVELDGISDVRQDLFIGMGRFLVQQDPHSFAGLHSAPHHCHKFWTYEVLDFAALRDPSFGAAQGRGSTGGRR